MKYRRTTLLAETNLTPAGTKTIDINIADPISRIAFSWRVTKASEGMASYAHKDITKIELVNGSEVLHSLDGGQNQALCIYDRGTKTMNHGQHLSSNSEFSIFGIDFGRFLFDPVLALDPKRFRNLQLKITYNFAVADTSATLGYLEVWAECFDEKVISPMGMLIAKNFESWSLSAASAYHYVDLPTDRVIRKMLLQGYRAAYEPWYQVMQWRIDEDNEKRIPFDISDLEDYYRMCKGTGFGQVHEQFEGLVQSGTKTYYLTPTDYYPNMSVMDLETQTATLGVSGRGGQFVLTRSGDYWVYGTVAGYVPNHCFCFPFGDQKDIDDWYDVTKIGSLRERLVSGSGTSGNVDTILQQLYKY